jgi:L-ascorbate metabolism protein UlaG (beta-lactamase superfamily)
VKIETHNQDRIDTIIQGTRIRSFFLQHDDRPEIENVGYLIEMSGIKILHTGDCTGSDTLQIKNLKLKNENIDLAFLNFYGYWRYKKSRDFLMDNINPKEIVLMHIPPNEIESIKESVNKISNFINISVFDKSMDRKSFNFK